jgi:tetratricopeptide (TPR) repeat protein
MDETKFQKDEVIFSKNSIRDAMKYWHNLEKLGEHQLAQLRIVENRQRTAGYPNTSLGRGQSLRDVLGELIKNLKPEDTEPKLELQKGLGNEWEYYVILRERYITKTGNRESPTFLIRLFNISRRTYARRLEEALVILSDELFEQEKRAQATQTLRNQLTASLIPPKPEHAIVPREEQLRTIKDRLTKSGKRVSIALCGWPGVGKTTVALLLARDYEVRKYFQDGILWAGFEHTSEPTAGPKKIDVLYHLKNWGKALGISLKGKTKSARIVDYKKTLNQQIGSGRMLIVIDNVWDMESVRKLQVGAPNCSYLITTRNLDIARRFAAANCVVIPELSEKEGLEMIAELAPKASSAYPEKVHELTKFIGGIPLALLLIGSYLNVESLSDQPRHLEDAFRQLSQSIYRLFLSENDVPIERPYGFSEDVPVTLAASIRFSEVMLDAQSRQTLQALSLFPPKPNTLSEEAALAVSGMTINTIDTLLARGLLESAGPGRYTMHPTISGYARIQTTDKKRFYERMLDFYNRFVEVHNPDRRTFELEMPNIMTGSIHSLDLNGVSYEIVKDYKTVLHVPFGAARHYRYGHLAMKFALYELAKDSFERALIDARIDKHNESISTLLNVLGEAQQKLGHLEEAENHLKEGLSIGRQINDRGRISAILATLGGIMIRHGRYEEAEAFLLEGLGIARKLRNDDLRSCLLANLGLKEAWLNRYIRAKKYFQEGLTLAQNKINLDHICLLHLHLAVVEKLLGHNRQAKKSLADALNVANEIGVSVRLDPVHNNIAILTETSDKVKLLQLAHNNCTIFQFIGHTVPSNIKKFNKQRLRS